MIKRVSIGRFNHLTICFFRHCFGPCESTPIREYGIQLPGVHGLLTVKREPTINELKKWILSQKKWPPNFCSPTLERMPQFRCKLSPAHDHQQLSSPPKAPHAVDVKKKVLQCSSTAAKWKGSTVGGCLGGFVQTPCSSMSAKQIHW